MNNNYIFFFLLSLVLVSTEKGNYKNNNRNDKPKIEL